MELGRLDFTIHLPTRLALSLLPHLCVSPHIGVFHGLSFVITWCNLLYPWLEASLGFDLVAIPRDLSIHASFLRGNGRFLLCATY